MGATVGVVTEAITLNSPPRLDAVVRPPGSKSLTNRALTLAAIARGSSCLRGALVAEDAQLMRGCLLALGIQVDGDEHELRLTGAGGPLIARNSPRLHVGLAGTVARFLTGVLAASAGHVVVDGTARMRERPMKMLVDALRKLGAAIDCTEHEGFLPVGIGPHDQPLRGGTVRLARPASSQFVSALLIAATLAAAPTTIVLEEGTPARPYVDMTLSALAAFGGDARWTQTNTLHVVPTTLRGCDYTVEPDASGASYFLALAAIHGGRMTIPDMGTSSQQGDAAFAPILGLMGADVEQSADETTVRGHGPLRGGDFDLADMPDMTLTLAVAAIYARGPTRIRGVGILRHHESDRLAAIAEELHKLGVDATEHDDGLDIEPPAEGPTPGIRVRSHGDHRMAMALSLVGNVVIEGPSCVAKTYPRYFDELRNLGMVASSTG